MKTVNVLAKAHVITLTDLLILASGKMGKSMDTVVSVLLTRLDTKESGRKIISTVKVS